MCKLGFIQENTNRYRPVAVETYDQLGNPLDFNYYFTTEEVIEVLALLQQVQPQEPQSENVEEVIIDEV